MIINLSGHDFILGMLVGAACVWIGLLTRTAHQRYEAMRAEHRAQVGRVRREMGRDR